LNDPEVAEVVKDCGMVDPFTTVVSRNADETTKAASAACTDANEATASAVKRIEHCMFGGSFPTKSSQHNVARPITTSPSTTPVIVVNCECATVGRNCKHNPRRF
jgi:hypothetical protein